jgi:protein-S-isoprenylcysteine O-methyltransferase Ste14
MIHHQTVVLSPVPLLVWASVAASWIFFWIAFGFRRRAPKVGVARRRSQSFWGLFVQGCGYFIVFGFRRRLFTPLAPMPYAAEIAVAVITIAIALGSVWLWLDAIRTLGKQFGLVARVMEGHKLITAGPYRRMRNPIYLSMFGLLLATGLAQGTWWGLVAAAPIFLIGTEIRISNEERVLRESFGAEFDAYARQVPAMFPRIF